MHLQLVPCLTAAAAASEEQNMGLDVRYLGEEPQQDPPKDGVILVFPIMRCGELPMDLYGPLRWRGNI